MRSTDGVRVSAWRSRAFLEVKISELFLMLVYRLAGSSQRARIAGFHGRFGYMSSGYNFGVVLDVGSPVVWECVTWWASGFPF